MTRLASVVLGLSLWFGGALSAQQPGAPPSLEHQGSGWLATLASSDGPEPQILFLRPPRCRRQLPHSTINWLLLAGAGPLLSFDDPRK
jgi:hypothetical protein